MTAYTWDAEDRLARIDLPGGSFAEYVYDGLGRRIQKDANGAVTRYVYDGTDILLEYDGTNFLLARTTHGPGMDDPVMLERDIDASGTFDAGERFFYQTDGLGSVTELTDSAGAVARSLVYDSYGQIAQDTGGVAQPFAFTGRELDSESGLYFYRARYYDAATGRFLSQDPLGFGAGDTNLYRYVFNNPIGLTDPSGQICLSQTEIAVISGALGSAAAGAVIGAPGGPISAVLFAAGGAAGGAAVGSIRQGFLGGSIGGAVEGAPGGGLTGALGGAIGGVVDSVIIEESGGGVVGGFLGGFYGGAIGGAVSGAITGGLTGAQTGGTVGAVVGATAGTISAVTSDILNAISDCPCD